MAETLGQSFSYVTADAVDGRGDSWLAPELLELARRRLVEGEPG